MALGWKRLALAAALVVAHAPAVQGAAAGAADGPTKIDVPGMLAPMVVENRLESYAYIVISLMPGTRDQVLPIREKMAFLRDAFLREVNKASIVKAGDPKAVDAAALKERLTARMNEILPKGMVSELKFEEITVSPVLAK